MDKRCYFRKTLSEKGFQISCAPFYRGSKKFANYFEKRLDKYIAMWYDKRLRSADADGFDFVKSLLVFISS